MNLQGVKYRKRFLKTSSLQVRKTNFTNKIMAPLNTKFVKCSHESVNKILEH